MPGLVINVVADTAAYMKGLMSASKATNTFSGELKQLSVSTDTVAKAQVAAAVKTTESLKAQAVAYRQLAAQAEKGSAEQVAAARLAAQAEQKLARSMGVTAAESKKAAASTRGLTRDIQHASRGALSGTGIFHGFARSLAFASGGFIAFEGITSILRESINAAREAGVAQRSLAAQMKASGESFRANREEIEKVALSYGKFGFNNDEVIAGLTVLERGTGKVNQSIRLLGLTADIARAKQIGFSAAAQVVAKVFGGQETALRRAVPGLEKNAHGWDLIREAQRKMAGQAAANTTAAEKFHSVLHNTEEIIGTALLPILNKYLNSLANWLQKMNESGRLEKDVQRISRDLATAFGVVTKAVKTMADAFKDLNKATGSSKHTLELLLGALIAFKRFRRAAPAAAAEGGGAAAAGGIVEGVGAGAILGGLARGAAGLSGLEAAGVGIAGYELSKLFRKIPGWDKDTKNWGAHLYDLAHALGLVGDAAKRTTRPFGVRGPVGKPGDGTPPGMQGPLGTPDVEQAKRSAQQLNQWFDAMTGRMLGRAQYQPLQQQLATFDKVAALLTQRIAKTKDITRKLNLEDQLLSVNNQRKQAREQLAQQFADGLQLNIDKAALTPGLQDDLQTIDAAIAYLDKRIAKETDIGKKQQLEEQRLGYISQRQAKIDEQWQTFLGGLSLGLQRAELTPSLNDDIAWLNATIAAYDKRIAKTKDLAKKQELESQQLDYIAQRNEKLKEKRQAAIDARTAAQFKILGLGAGGEALTPTARVLAKDVDRVIAAFQKAGVKIPPSIAKMMANIRKVLAQAGKGISKDVRDAIFQMIQDALAQLANLKTKARQTTGGGGVGAPAFVPHGPAVMLPVDLPPAPRQGGPKGFMSLGGSVYTGDIHVHGVQNPREFEQEMQKRSMSRPHTRRGPV